MEGFIAIALLLVVPALCAWMLRWLNVPGWAIIGGVMGGMLLGPTLFGRVVPETYETLFVGGVQQREELHRLHGRHGADLLAAQHAGADRDLLHDMQQQHSRERAIAEANLRQARWGEQLPQRALGVALVCMTLVGARVMSTSKERHATAPGIAAPLTIGLWAATVPGALTLAACIWWWQQSPAEAALVAAAVMIGPWTLTSVDRIAAERAERGGAALVRNGGHFASLLALAAAGWSLWSLRGMEGLLWLLPLLAVFAALRRGSIAGSPQPTGRRWLRQCLQFVILPALAASVSVKIELFQHFAFWPMLVLLILSGDGRWIGAVIGTLLLGGRTGMHAMKLSLGAMACGPTQMSVIAIAAHAWLLDESMLFALLAGAVYVEASVPMRRWVTTW